MEHYRGYPQGQHTNLVVGLAFLIVHVLVGRIIVTGLFSVNTCRYGRGLVKNSASLLQT